MRRGRSFPALDFDAFSHQPRDENRYHFGLSGTWRRMKRTPRPTMAPKAPAERGRHGMEVNQNDRPERAYGRANPECGVDHEVFVAANARGNELIHGGIDGGVFAPDAAAC